MTFVKYIQETIDVYCLEEIKMQGRNLRGKILKVGLEGRAVLEWLGKGGIQNVDPGEQDVVLGPRRNCEI